MARKHHWVTCDNQITYFRGIVLTSKNINVEIQQSNMPLK